MKKTLVPEVLTHPLYPWIHTVFNSLLQQTRRDISVFVCEYCGTNKFNRAEELFEKFVEEHSVCSTDSNKINCATKKLKGGTNLNSAIDYCTLKVAVIEGVGGKIEFTQHNSTHKN